MYVKAYAKEINHCHGVDRGFLVHLEAFFFTSEALPIPDSALGIFSD